jgi:predicted XRE-type DNA-binding protein
VPRGRIDKCTIDRLVKMLAKVGRHVKLSIEAQAA